MSKSKMTRRILTVVKNPEHPDEMLLDLGNELCAQLKWKPGDELVWIDNKDGSWTVKKKIS